MTYIFDVLHAWPNPRMDIVTAADPGPTDVNQVYGCDTFHFNNILEAAKVLTDAMKKNAQCSRSRY